MKRLAARDFEDLLQVSIYDLCELLLIIDLKFNFSAPSQSSRIYC